MQRDHRAETGHDLLAHEIAEQSSAGDVNCRNTVLRYCDRLARTLATVINLLDPEVIVLGGGVSNIEAIYEEVPKRWAKYTFCEQVRTRLVRNEHGDASGVRGAARL